MGCICRRGHPRRGHKWPWMATPERATRRDQSGSDLPGEADLVAAAEIDFSRKALRSLPGSVHELDANQGCRPSASSGLNPWLQAAIPAGIVELHSLMALALTRPTGHVRVLADPPGYANNLSTAWAFTNSRGCLRWL